jgi:hypothetical protein
MTDRAPSPTAGAGETAPHDRSAYYLAQLLGWGLYAAFIYLLSPGPKTLDAAATILLWCGCGLLGTQALHGYLSRRPERTGWELAGSFGAAIVLIPLVMVSIQTLSYGILEPRSYHGGALAHFFQAVLVTCLWCALYFSAREFRKRRAAEMEALRLALVAQVAQFRTLRSQLNPHFLFNCLNSLHELIEEDRERAKQLVMRLSDLLRYTLRADSVEAVPLREELAAVEDYLALEKIRFEERLRLRYRIAPETLSARLPPMLLQTLAENGLKHGIGRLSAGGELSIETGVADGQLQIAVTNTGTLAPPNGSTAIGLENARERLRLVCGDRASLSLHMEGDQRVRAVVTIPWPEKGSGAW